MTDDRGALADVRVLDLLDGPGAYATRVLTGLGAEVIRVEPPRGSVQRRRRSFADGLQIEQVRIKEEGSGLYFLHYNAGKKGITLDLSHPEGRNLLRCLLDRVDIVFDNGQLARAGFDLHALAGKQPTLVAVSITPFGLAGPRADWAAGDFVCQAMSGMIGLFGYRDTRPARFAPEQAYEMAGLAAALAALIALFAARREGCGEFVDIALERVCTLVTLQIANASVYHQFGVRRERKSPEETRHGALYQAKDGYFLLGAYRQPDRLIAMLASVGMADELRALRSGVSSEAFSRDPRAEAIVAAFCATLSRAELAETVQAHSLNGLPVHDVADLLVDPFLRARAFFAELELPALPAPLADAGPPARLGATPYRIGPRSPLLGEHNAEVYGAIGVDEDRLAALREAGAI